MGFSVQSIEYMANAAVQPSDTRALGNTGQYNYWTRITVRTDDYGCTNFSVYLDAICYDGAVNMYYNAGAYIGVGTSPDPGTYVGPGANMTATYMGNNQQRWTFNGSLPVSMKANTTYYIFLLPCWTEPDTFIRYLNAPPTITVQSDWPHYNLSISAGTGSTAGIYRSASAEGAAVGDLSNGDIIFYGDTLVFTYSAQAGYVIDAHTVNGTPQSSGYSFSVAGAVSVVVTATAQNFTLSLSAGTGSSISVNRTSSPKQGAPTGPLYNGDTIYYDDVLQITFTPSTGYDIDTHTVNGAPFTSGDTLTVASSVSVVSTAVLKTFTLSISEGTGSTVVVKKGGATLVDGSTVTYNDVLTITFTESTGYDLATHTVNGTPFVSGDTHTVTGAVSVVATASVKSFTLTLSPGTGTAINVSRTSSPKQGATLGVLVSGATVYYSDVLSVNFSAQTGYDLASKTINGSGQSGTSVSHTVTAAVTVAATASVKSFTLTIDQGVGATITVERTSSPKQGAASGVLSNGDTIYYSDELTVDFAAGTGYTLSEQKINGSAQASPPVTWTVAAAVTVKARAAATPYSLTITKSSSGVVVMVFRTSSPIGGGAIQMLSENDPIYYNDVLSVSYSLAAGYQIETHTINGSDFDSGDSYTVMGDTVIVVTADAAGFVYIKGEPYLIMIGNGAAYDRYLAEIGNGSTYDDY